MGMRMKLDGLRSGVREIVPRTATDVKFRESILIGITKLNLAQVREFIAKNEDNYKGDDYDVLEKNCNHFSNDLCYKLTGQKIPSWVNRLAKLGSTLKCVH
ncbi:unnamed protein product [Cuscuta epithymum]|uniref:PPPDE domain-containing protein n=1 Tax=Cuscuta epithymum TaxID=186058 RepID=A0AAV0EA79_9ASTE|nr:unnamed protein product [Cuscuta epithymum]